MPELVDALEQLYRDRYTQFWNGLAALVHDDDLAHDVLQEAFARALRSRETFRGDGQLAGWVWRIALRTAYEHRRPRRDVSIGEWLDPSLPEPERDPALAAALRRLPPRKRTIVFLRYFADLSQEEIAVACGIARGTVAASLAQAHAFLLEQLKPEKARAEA
jgi:RNA polymerase sigma-70 factor (ECF subfamily)